MSIQVTDPIGAIVVLAVILLVGWLIVYTASLMAISDRLSAPVIIVAAARPLGSRVALVLTNSGSRPAYQVHLSVGRGGSAGQLGREIAAIPVLAPGVPVQIEIDRADLGVGPGAPLPTILRAGWRKSALPGSGSSFDDVPVVVIEDANEAPSGGA
jgi:hypothetical protein